MSEPSLFETALLGGIFFEPTKLDLVVEKLKPDDFESKLMRLAYSAMCELHEQGTGIDVTTVSAKIKSELPNVNTHTALMSLYEENSIDLDVVYYADHIVDQSRRRTFISACKMAIEQTKNTKNMTDVFDSLSNTIENVYKGCESEKMVNMQESWTRFAEQRQSEMENKGALKMRTHIDTVDKILGDIEPGQMITIAAANGGGKTTLGLNILRNIATLDKIPVLLITLEMTITEVAVSTLAAHARIEQNVLKANTDQARQQAIEIVANALTTIQGVQMDIFASTVDRFAGVVRKIRKHTKAFPRCKVVMIDYIGLMNMGDNTKNTRAYEVGEMTRTLKSLAMELDIAIILLAQVNRSNTSRADKSFILTDLRESGSIASDSNAVLFIEGEAGDAVTKINIAKNRNGRTGVANVYYNRALATFKGAMPTPSPAIWVSKSYE